MDNNFLDSERKATKDNEISNMGHRLGNLSSYSSLSTGESYKPSYKGGGNHMEPKSFSKLRQAKV